MSALDLSLEDLIKQRAKPAQKTAKAKPRRAAARGGGKKTVVRKKTAGKRPRDARGSIFDRLGNADGAKTVEVRNVPYDVLESELRRLFEACGTIKACRMALDASGRSFGRATITFANPRGGARGPGREDALRRRDARRSGARGPPGDGAAGHSRRRRGADRQRPRGPLRHGARRPRPRPGARRPRSQEGRTRGSPRPRPRAHGHGGLVDTARLSAFFLGSRCYRLALTC